MNRSKYCDTVTQLEPEAVRITVLATTLYPLVRSRYASGKILR